MSPRPRNRTLGATSLELKCLFLFGVFLLLVVTVSFLMYWYVTYQLVDLQNPAKGRLLADQVMLIEHWKSLEKEDPSWQAYLARQGPFGGLADTLSLGINEEDCEVRLILPHEKISPLDDAEESERETFETTPPRDADERELLDRFMQYRPADGQSQDIESYDRVVAGRYQYYQAIRAQKSCTIVCHGTSQVMQTNPLFGSTPEPLNPGDLMAVIQVSIPNRPTQDLIDWTWNTLLAVAIITGFLAMIAFYITIRYVIVKPLRHLHDVSDAISRGNIAMRAEIRTGDEFESLSLAFNRMLRHLVTIQDELRRANTQLDGKVDELAQVNMQLYEMNRIKSDFLSTMSHELRTPLNSILGFSDVLGAIDSLDDKQKRYVQNIRSSGRLLLEMINNILDLAKMESGKMDVQITEFNIAAVIAAQCDMARPLTERKNIDLDTEIPPDLPPMEQDQNRVHQILNNLLSNAIKFTPEGGRIKVTAQQTDRQELILKVIDTGVGITADDQKTIFEKFRQGNTAMPGGDAITREYSGTGLGLSIVKELCKLLDGEVSVESELGTGSTFTVRLPWKLEERPRLDSPLVASFKQFSQPRLDPMRPAVAEPLSAGAAKKSSDD